MYWQWTLEIKLKNAVPFIKKMKYLGINLTKQMLDLVKENYNMLIKESEDDVNH